jgi:hypothetical protein
VIVKMIGLRDHRDRRIARLEREIDELHDRLHRIRQWIDAYPLDTFPEPDMKKVAKVLRDNKLTLDAVSASNMRHVLEGLKTIVGPET